jgi:hypothetical protein
VYVQSSAVDKSVPRCSGAESVRSLKCRVCTVACSIGCLACGCGCVLRLRRCAPCWDYFDRLRWPPGCFGSFGYPQSWPDLGQIASVVESLAQRRRLNELSALHLDDDEPGYSPCCYCSVVSSSGLATCSGDRNQRHAIAENVCCPDKVGFADGLHPDRSLVADALRGASLSGR